MLDLPQPVARIPYIMGSSDKVDRILHRHNIKRILTLLIGQALRPVKDQIRMESPGYGPLSLWRFRGLIHRGMKQEVRTRLEEHKTACRLTVRYVRPSRGPSRDGSAHQLQFTSALIRRAQGVARSIKFP